VNSAVKNIVFWVVMAVTALLIWVVVKNSAAGAIQELSFTSFVNEVSRDNVREVQIAGTDVSGTLKKDSAKFKTTIPANYPDLYKTLTEKNVSVVIKDSSGGSWLSSRELCEASNSRAGVRDPRKV